MKKASDAGGKYTMATLQWVDTTTPQLGKLLEIMYAASQASEQVTASALERSLRNLLIMAAALVFVIAIVLACLWIVSTRITQPLLRLSKVTERLAREIGEITRLPEVQKRLSALGYELDFAGSERFRELIAADHQRFGTVIRDAGVAPN